jgi:hypothetical protein
MAVEKLISSSTPEVLAAKISSIMEIPEAPHEEPERNGYPVLSDGVTRELTHAEECTKETYIIWQSRRTPSPFTHATRMFNTVNQFCSFISSR